MKGYHSQLNRNKDNKYNKRRRSNNSLFILRIIKIISRDRIKRLVEIYWAIGGIKLHKLKNITLMDYSVVITKIRSNKSKNNIFNNINSYLNNNLKLNINNNIYNILTNR